MDIPTTPNENTRLRARLALGFAALALSLLGFESFRAFREINRARDDVSQVGRTYVASVQMLVALAESVSATRGYAITGDETFRQQSVASREQVRKEAAQLERLYPLLRHNRGDYERLLRLVQQRLELLLRVVTSREQGGTSAAFQHIGTPEVLRLDREIAELAQRLQQSDVEELDGRLAGAAALGRRTIVLLVLAVAGGLILVAWVYMILRLEREIKREAASRMEKEVRRFRELFENSPDAMVLVGKDQRISQVNTRAGQIFGVPLTDLINAPLDRLMPERFRTRHRSHMDAYFAHPRSRPMGAGLELIGLKGDGTEFPVEIMLSPMQEADGLQVLAVVRDVTERVAAEQSIRKLNEDLQRRATELEMANHELEAFSYSVSHDLRAPLRHVQGFAEMLKSHAAAKLDEKSQRYLHTIGDAARRMSALIDDLLLFSRTGRVQIAHQRVSLGQLVDEVRQGLQEETEGRTIGWKVHTLPEVWGDLAMLRQVVFNLLANAVKYTRHRPDTQIEVGVAATQNPSEVVCFVRDNGAGFDMKYAHKLFGVFQRLHADADFEGTGVGLALVRRIVHRLGGRTWAEGAVGQGATFYFSIPAFEPTQS